MGQTTGARRRMLVVDDERDIVDMLATYFTMQGFDVLRALSSEEALCRVNALAGADGVDIDVILLDVSMPGMDGLDLCRRLREAVSCPIIFLTARIEDADQIEGFVAGADDYVTKPFSLEVLSRRVAAHLEREKRHRSQTTVRFSGDVLIDYAKRTVRVGSEEVQLTRTEFDIVAMLSKNAGRVFDRNRIYEEVWGWDAAGDPTFVTEHIRRARKKLVSAGAPEKAIATVWGVGYKWTA